MIALVPDPPDPPVAPARRPRLGFVGVGWIGRLRLAALVESRVAEVVAVADPSAECREAALAAAPRAILGHDLEALLELGLDGVVIATPSALHAAQCIAALERGLAVFCQKPLARTAAETRRVVDAARAADRLLGVDLAYRHTDAVRALRRLVERGLLGRIYAANLVFHNAYGPDKPWFDDRALAGGGCLLDLGTHLVDLAMWLLGDGAVRVLDSRLYRSGRPLAGGDAQVEEYAAAQLLVEPETVVQLACSWRLSAGHDCVIEIALHGSDGGAVVRNLDGSFYDFVAEHHRGTASERVAAPPDAWGGRALVDWAERLARGERFDPQAERLVRLADTLDRIYAGGWR